MGRTGSGARFPVCNRCLLPPRSRRPTFSEVVAELVQIEVDFRLQCHRTSKRDSSGSGAGSLSNSRPGSPERRQLHSASLG